MPRKCHCATDDRLGRHTSTTASSRQPRFRVPTNLGATFSENPIARSSLGNLITRVVCVKCCTGDCWRFHRNTGAEGGQYVRFTSEADCLTACVNNHLCTGVDLTFTSSHSGSLFSLNDPPRCYLHGPWSGSHNHHIEGSYYYNYTCRGKRNSLI